MAATDLEWVGFRDFSAGIRHVINPRNPPGAAQEESTYRCIALPQGGLGPLPLRDFEYNPVTAGGTAKYINGLHVTGPVSGATGSQRPHELHYSVEEVNQSYKWVRRRLFEASPTDDVLRTETGSTVTGQVEVTTFATTRSNRANLLLAGLPIVCAAWYAAGGAGTKFVRAFPDETAPNTVGTYAVNTTNAYKCFAHQGRLVLLKLSSYQHATGSWNTNEQLQWFRPNEVLATYSLPTDAIYDIDNPSGYWCWQSLTANELLLIKGKGALFVRGDLDDPTVISLPNVPGNAMGQGTPTPIGFVYGERQGGLYLWSGGDQAELLSPYMNQGFLRHSGTDGFLGSTAQFDRWGDWAMLSNNWLFDTRTKSFWRIDKVTGDDGVRVWAWSIPPAQNLTNYAYAAVPRCDDDEPGIYGWVRSQKATSWSWLSHPVYQSIERQVNVRQVLLLAEGDGAVTITLTSDQSNQWSETFALSGTGYPELFRANCALYGSNVTVRIEADNTDNEDDAPVVYEVNLGIDTRMRVGVTS